MVSDDSHSCIMFCSSFSVNRELFHQCRECDNTGNAHTSLVGTQQESQQPFPLFQADTGKKQKIHQGSQFPLGSNPLKTCFALHFYNVLPPQCKYDLWHITVHFVLDGMSLQHMSFDVVLFRSSLGSCLPYTQTLRVQGLHKLFLCWWAQIIWYSVACFVLSVGWNHQEFCSWISSISCFVAKTKIQQKQVLSERKDDGYKNFEFFLVRRVVTREINSGAKMGWINDVYWLAQGQYWKPDMPVETYPAY